MGNPRHTHSDAGSRRGREEINFRMADRLVQHESWREQHRGWLRGARSLGRQRARAAHFPDGRGQARDLMRQEVVRKSGGKFPKRVKSGNDCNKPLKL